MQLHLKRRLAGAMMVLALAVSACSQPPISPAPPRPQEDPQPPGPGTTPTPPSPVGVAGTIEVTSRLTAAGGYEYAIQVRLTEQAGLASVVTKLSAIADCDCGPMGPFGPEVQTSAPAAWIGDDNHLAAYGTLASKPLVIRDEAPDLYAAYAVVDVTYSDGPSSNRTLTLIAPMPPHPDPPTEERIRLDGIVRDSVTEEPVAGVLVRIATGPDALRETRTDALGRFTFEAIRTGRFRVSFARSGYFSQQRSIFVLTPEIQRFNLKKG